MAKKGAWLNDKNVVVTGAGSGIGAGLTEKLIKEHNCYVIGVDLSEQRLQQTAENLGSDADRFEYRAFDASVKENWEHFAAEMKTHAKTPSVLINCAGILPNFKRTDRYTDEEIERVMNVNFFAGVYGVRAMLPILLKQDDPGIVNIASGASLMTLAGTAFYSASKSATRAFTEALRVELRGKCYVGVVCPGFTSTNIMKNLETTPMSLKLLDLASVKSETMVGWIFHGIEKKKAMMVYAFDAWAMFIFNRLFPVLGPTLFSSAMKLAHMDVFKDIFKD